MARVPTRQYCAGQLNSRRQTGAYWEHQARLWLESKGLQFHSGNFRLKGGEIDLIMQHGSTIVFVEVRYRQSSRFGGAAASITWQKQRKLLQTASVWLARRNHSFDTVDCRFDVLAFTGHQTEWIINAFSTNDF